MGGRGNGILYWCVCRYDFASGLAGDSRRLHDRFYHLLLDVQLIVKDGAFMKVVVVQFPKLITGILKSFLKIK